MYMLPVEKVIGLSGRDLRITPDFSGEELQERRARLASAVGPDAHVLLPSAPPVPEDRVVEDANFYYFSGLTRCHAFVLIEGGTGRSTLFLPSRDTMDGEPSSRLGFEDADLLCSRLLFDAVCDLAQLGEALTAVRCTYMPHAEVEGGGATKFGANTCANTRAADEWDQVQPRHKRLIQLLQERYPAMTIEDACPLINPMRTIKSPAEIAVMRQAGQLSARVMIESMKATRPGLCENRLQAIAEYIFRAEGHCGSGYGVIVAGGTRTMDGHYHFNNALLGEDEIVLMDCGPDLRHYSSDIARLWPVNGVFSPWHRRMYGFIVAYHKTLLALVRPGVCAPDIYAEAARRMRKLCEGENAPFADMRPRLEQMIEAGVRYLNHGVGLSVHDAMDRNWKTEPLREGFVCALDPMIWCRDVDQYIRVEDTIVVTADGCERLTGDAPFEIDEIEAVMKQPSAFPL